MVIRNIQNLSEISDLIPVQEVKDELRICHTQEDEKIARYIASAVHIFEKETGLIINKKRYLVKISYLDLSNNKRSFANFSDFFLSHLKAYDLQTRAFAFSSQSAGLEFNLYVTPVSEVFSFGFFTSSSKILTDNLEQDFKIVDSKPSKFLINYDFIKNNTKLVFTKTESSGFIFEASFGYDDPNLLPADVKDFVIQYASARYDKKDPTKSAELNSILVRNRQFLPI